jgi:alpha-glucosidase
MKPIRQATFAGSDPRGATFDCGDGITCRIAMLGADIARVLFLRGGAVRQPRTWMVPARGAVDVPWEGRNRLDDTVWPTLPVAVTQNADHVVIATDALRVTVSLRSFALTWALADGTVFARDREAHATSFGRTAIRHAFARHEDDRYYGLGDKTGPLDLHGRRLRTTMMDSLGYNPEHGDPLYKHWPFLIARDGASGVSYGVLYDNMAAATFDLGCEHDNYYGAFRSYEAECGDLDYYLFVGPRLADVTPKFLALTGMPALPPRWTLGYAQTAMAIADSPNAQERIEAFIDRCAAEHIPVGAFHFGSGYTMIGPKRYVFNWNRQKFPDPEGLMRRFHAAGMHVVANLKPCLLDDHPRYAEPLAHGAYVNGADGTPAISQFWDGEGAHLDFTHPDAIAWWQRGLREHVLATGIDCAWNDNNEYGFWNEDAVCNGFGTAMPLDLARPLQPLLMTRASIEEQRRYQPAERAFTVTRAGCPGIQRYAQTWSGDNTTNWRSLKWNLRTGLQMSLSGMGNTGHDIGGFAGPVPEAELLVRWTQAGALHPRFIMNSWKPDGVYTSPWLHPEATAFIRVAIRLRLRLMPYIYSLMHEYSANGIAPLQPLFTRFEDDPAAFDDTDALMLGPYLLGHPVTEPGRRDIEPYLPAGPECWFDAWSGEVLKAGQSAQVAAPLDRLPLLVPAGAILPLAAPDDGTTRDVLIFPGPATGTSRFVLWEDDGVSPGGPVTKLAFDLRWTPAAVELHLASHGDHPLSFDTLGVGLPPMDRRPLRLTADDGAPALAAGAIRLADHV